MITKMIIRNSNGKMRICKSNWKHIELQAVHRNPLMKINLLLSINIGHHTPSSIPVNFHKFYMLLRLLLIHFYTLNK